MDIRYKTISVTTDTAGAYSETFTPPGPVLEKVVYQGGGDISSLADLTLTDYIAGDTLFSFDNFGSTAGFTRYPRHVTCNAVGAADSTTDFDNPVAQKMTFAISSTVLTGTTGTFSLVFSA